MIGQMCVCGAVNNRVVPSQHVSLSVWAAESSPPGGVASSQVFLHRNVSSGILLKAGAKTVCVCVVYDTELSKAVFEGKIKVQR